MTAEQKIVELFKQNPEWTVQELSLEVLASKQLIHRILKKLTEQQEVQKFGTSPKTFYRKIKHEISKNSETILNKDDVDFLKKEFLVITEKGEYLEGKAGFENWCQKRNLPVEKTLNEFKITKEKYNQHIQRNGLIDGTEKLINTKGFEKIYLDRLYYLDFYAIERFGKTKLGTILHYAKQGQNKFLMNILMKEISEKIKKFIEESGVQAIGFVPPTIRREVQLMKFIEKGLKTHLPILDIKKMSGIIPVPQKSLNKLEERIGNADSTFVVFGNSSYESVLLIDDAVGSGATINQISKKIKEKNIAQKVIGIAIVGSYKGFEVITDV